jgi:hypothetical protein
MSETGRVGTTWRVRQRARLMALLAAEKNFAGPSGVCGHEVRRALAVKVGNIDALVSEHSNCRFDICNWECQDKLIWQRFGFVQCDNVWKTKIFQTRFHFGIYDYLQVAPPLKLEKHV